MSNLNTVANSETAHMGWPSELVELRWFSQDYLLPDPRRASGLLPVQREHSGSPGGQWEWQG